MNFINLQIFWWIPVILIFMGLLFWRARVRRTNIMRLILGPRAKDGKHVQLSLTRRLFRFLLLLFVMLMLIVAIARPTWKLHLVPYQSSGRDLMVLFDVSKSMLAQDIRPSRLAHAKLFLRDLVNHTGSDRFGLVAFAGRAFLECPMTTDKTSFIQYVDELDTQSIPLGGTNLQLALETAMKAFDAAEGNNRAIVLITDGDELTGNSKLALGELKKANIPLLIVGVGGSATPALIPIPQAKGQSVKFMRDSKGELVKTRLNVTLMQQLADTTGGYFVHSTTTNFGLEQIEAGIKKLLPAELEKGEKTRPVERFYYFLAFATIILWLWMLISEHPGKKRRHLAKAAAIFVISILFAAQNTANAEALPKLPTPTKKPAPPVTDPVKAYNQAREIQLKKKGDSSKLYETAINLAGKNPGVRTNSFNNLGVNQHQKARQAVMQAVGKVKQQNLDGAISQLEGSKKILDLAEEMYVKALSTKKPKNLDEEKEAVQESARSQTAINQQLLLNDRVMIDKLIKKIKELKKQQKKAQKQTKKAQKQQQKKNKQKKQDKKQQQKKQDNKQKQQQKKQDNKQKQQQKKQDNKQKQQQKKQDNKQKQQQKKQDNKQKQQQKSNDELKKAQNDVKKLEKQAKELGQKKIEKQAQKAKKELDKAEKSRKNKQGKKAEEHIKKALEQLKPKASDKNKKKKDKKGKGKDKKDKQKNKDKKKDKGKDGKDKKLPKPQEQSAKQGKAKKAPKDINPKEARKLLKLMTEKEKDFRKALKAHRKQQYKNIKVEKDW
jgi:Ca-activated chloride channel homolog